VDKGMFYCVFMYPIKVLSQGLQMGVLSTFGQMQPLLFKANFM